MNYLDKHLDAYTGNIVYDFDNNILLNWYPHRIIEKAQQCKSILELGLGHGFSTKVFNNHFERHVVIDGSKAVIDNFIQNNQDCTAELINSFFEDFDTTERFDIIVLGFILEHVENPIQTIKHFMKFLNPDGKFFIAVPNAQVLNRRIGHLAGLLPDIESLSDNDILLGHKRYYTVDSLTKDVVISGFKMVKMEGIYLKPFTTNQIFSLNLDNIIINALCEIGVNYPELSCGLLAEIK